jgi:transcription initiation factor TFIIIB Brf1 subunit/transcription initiation factor TFIIB
MHFHLPKPLHGWREFAGEVGIIVVGVLIALGMEQIAQSWHEQRATREAREAIKTEVAEDLGGLLDRTSAEACIQRRFDEIGQFIDQASAGTVPAPPTWISRPPTWNMDSFRWEAASQAGRVSLLPTAEQSNFSDIYGSFKTIGQTEADEQQLWARLRSLEGRQHVSDATAATMRSNLSEARYADWIIRILVLQISDDAKLVGASPVMDQRSRSPKVICLPMNTSRAAALKLASRRFGAP